MMQKLSERETKELKGGWTATCTLSYCKSSYSSVSKTVVKAWAGVHKFVNGSSHSCEYNF